MTDKLETMRSFVAAFNEGGARDACRTFLAEDFECYEPPELPQGGVFTGWDAPLRINAIYGATWNIEIISADFYDVAGSDMVMSRFVMKWTHKGTGKSVTEPIVELNTIVGGKIRKMEVFHFDAAGLLATAV